MKRNNSTLKNEKIKKNIWHEIFLGLVCVCWEWKSPLKWLWWSRVRMGGKLQFYCYLYLYLYFLYCFIFY